MKNSNKIPLILILGTFAYIMGGFAGLAFVKSVTGSGLIYTLFWLVFFIGYLTFFMRWALRILQHARQQGDETKEEVR